MNFIDLKTQYRGLKPDIDAAIMNVLNHGRYVMGPEIEALESQLAEFTGARHVVSCASGTDALLMALMAKNVGPGDAVFTSPFTFFASAEVIALLGATPVFVDIDAATFNIDVKKLEQSIEKVANAGKLNLRGIIPVDLFGQPADYANIQVLADKHDLFVLEDAAQSLGSTLYGSKAGALAECAATSFYPAKPLGCYGDGGAVFTDSDELVELLKSIRSHGQGASQYDNVRLGITGRMDSIQAAVLCCKLKVFAQELKRRQEIAKHYNELLADHVQTPSIIDGAQSAWALYTIQLDRRDQIKQTLAKAGVPSVIYYPKPLHLQQAFAGLGYKKGDLPVSEKSCERVLSLPMHPGLTAQEVETVAEQLISATQLKA
ncbi:MAG: DegT/DnrJ/EryC1/StrS family aminotransferase [Arenicellales bacterium WSBS_2016_MAG_OTU3]